NFPALAGLSSAIVGTLVIFGWYCHWMLVVRIFPNGAPMQYNSALCFIAGGIALALLTTRKAHLSPWLGAGVLGVGVFTAIEYLAKVNLGIDTLFFKPYLQTAIAHPGRMSPLAASCFVCFGAGLMLTAFRRRRGPRLAVM